MGPGTGETVAGRYRLERRIGAGGFGQVWAAEDTVLGVPVALKEIRLAGAGPDERHELRVRAAREARHAARLRDHPNIVTVHDVVEADGLPWIVMQLVTGRSLAEELRTAGPLDEPRALALARALLAAVRAAHAEGIVHRDIKPANVLLTERGEILLTDFGIAVDPADTRLTPTNALVGTPGYTAPERWQGAPSSGPSDLYSLGATLYEAVEGELPFPRSNPVAALLDDPRSPRRAGPRLTPLLALLLQRDPADRPDPAQALALLDADPAASPAPPTPARTRTPTPAPTPAPAPAPEQVLLTGTKPGSIAGRTVRGTFVVMIAGLFPLITYQKHLPGPERYHFVYFVALVVLGVLLSAGLSVLARRQEKPDRVTIGPKGFTVTSGTGPQELWYSVDWASLDRVALTPDLQYGTRRLVSEVSVWFRPGREPTEEWLSTYKIGKQPNGSYHVYPCLRYVPTVPLLDWEEPLRAHAGPLYVDSHPAAGS
ncbi:serine/threonine-protein kinase [Kitasatospora sp. NPDC057198]|uniref:serine/threonine-protein kinase n=1 Tax=Kitasatospora sp. NPDC057198 TaxID=3346046 RepID=UPI0036367267